MARGILKNRPNFKNLRHHLNELSVRFFRANGTKVMAVQRCSLDAADEGDGGKFNN